MRIAYDLRFADGHFTGIGTHAFVLLDEMLGLPTGDTWDVLWHRGARRDRYPLERIQSHPRVRWCETDARPLHPLDPWRTGAWLRKVRPDVYYSPFYFLPLGAPCPSVLTIHDVWPLRMPEGLSPLRHLIYRMSLARARGARFIFTSSEFSRREIVALMGMEPSRVRAIRLGTPPLHEAAGVSAPARAPEGPFALVVGDNRPRKNLRVLAEAWARMGDAPALQLVSAGPADPRYPSLECMAAETGARGIVALGWTPEPELAWLYGRAAVVLFPTRYEGFGFPLVEAFQRGLPVIASDIPTLREIGTGVAEFVAEDDPGAWVRAITGIVASPERRSTMAEAGRVRAAELSYRRTAEATLELLREATATQGRQPRGASAPRRA